MKNLLIIDTATTKGSITLFSDGSIIQEFIEEKNQTKEVVPLIKKILKNAKISLCNIDALCICTGPGAFTGTRVGVMSAKTLSYAVNIPLIPFSTFELFAKPNSKSVIDAKCRQYYLYENEEISLISLEELSNLKGSIYYIEDSIDRLRLDNLTRSKKNIRDLIPKLLEKAPLSFDKIEVYYPPER